MRSAIFGLGFSALALAAWTACVGDKPTDSASGASGQACYANGTCLGTLACRNGRCEEASVEGGASSSSSTSSSSGATSSSGNASSGSTSGSTCTATPSKAGPQCAGAETGACDSGETCCQVGSGAACTTTCAGDAWQCDDQSQCGTGFCCVSADRQVRNDACGVNNFGAPTSHCVEKIADCTGLKQYRTCNASGDCVGGDDLKDCVVHDIVTVGGTHALVGVCEGK